jgi:hypothetical protein
MHFKIHKVTHVSKIYLCLLEWCFKTWCGPICTTKIVATHTNMQWNPGWGGGREEGEFF